MNPAERAARREKLPRWVLEEFRVLEMRLREAEQAAASVDIADADAYTDPYGKFPKPAAQKGEAIRFPLDGLGGHNWVDVRRRGDGIELMASSGLSIIPQVTNVVRVRIEER